MVPLQFRLLLAPFHFMSRILFSDLKLERDGRDFHIRIAAPEAEPQALSEEAIAEAAPLQAALKALLDSHPQARRVLRHLRYVERALATQGLAALAAMPVDVLTMALRQLDLIVSNGSSRHLADLRSKMTVAVLAHPEEPQYGENGDRLSDFATESRLMVADASHSVFMELERQYEALLPPEAIRASLDTTRTAP